MGQMVLELEQNEHRGGQATEFVPGWVPRSVQNYIDHTEMGVPIRALARQQGCHASTILRQIRRVETLRDDPLVDEVLKTLGGTPPAAPNSTPSVTVLGTADATGAGLPDMVQLSVHGLRVLRRLCENGAVLAVAADMEKAVIVRDGRDGENTRTGVVDRAIAEAMALKGWIATSQTGRIARYHITTAGRSALADMMARDESARAGLAMGDADAVAVPQRVRYGMAESPLAALARRRDRDGIRFLSREMVRAGERLREDFEMAQMGATQTTDWDGFLETLHPASAPNRQIPCPVRNWPAPVWWRPCRIWGRGCRMWSCGAVAFWKGWKLRKRLWAGPRGRARLSCVSHSCGWKNITPKTAVQGLQ